MDEETLQMARLLKKEAQKLHVDQRKLSILERLKEEGGPFINTEQVQTFLDNVNDENRKMAQKQLRDEVTYARDTSTSLPRAHYTVHKIMSEDTVTKKNRLKPEEFGENLNVLLGNASDRDIR